MPRKFKPADGVRSVRFCSPPSFACGNKKTRGYKAKGLRYEGQVQKRLDALENWESFSGVWFEFTDKNGYRLAQLDWLGFNYELDIACIVEIKLSRVERGWWQLNKLYYPLVQHMFGSWPIALVEVVSNIRGVDVPGKVAGISHLNIAKPDHTSVMRIPYAG